MESDAYDYCITLKKTPAYIAGVFLNFDITFLILKFLNFYFVAAGLLSLTSSEKDVASPAIP